MDRGRVGEDRGSKEMDGCPLTRVFSLDSPWLGKCCVLFLLDLYIYFGFPLARLKWSSLPKLVRLPLQ
jgi:hypothetical protein